MSSEEFQAAHDSIYNTGTRLLQYLQEIRQGRFSEGDDTKGLQSVEDEINKALHALKEQKYQVAVIAAMKAGKSTFLNAVIGADVLASESEACTVCRTDIRPIDASATPRLLEYRQGQKKPVVIAEGDSSVIRQKFLDHTHKLRATANHDNTTRFELEHPIEAISKLSSLTGFTLVDTPGPNEWESAGFSTVTLKQTALEALRTCDAILFVLDYSSFKDNTNSELLQDLIAQRGEFLANNTGKIYFILNKVDRKAEGDRAINDVIADLKQALIGFGIPDPIIYPTSAWQGLLAKLIQQGTASDSHLKNFKRFFSAKYAIENEEGDSVTPAPKKIAPQALKDSFIPTIEESVIQTVVQNSGWNLLSDVLASLIKAGKSIEDTLNTRFIGWEMEIETLKQKVEEYRKRAISAKRKVEDVKNSVEQQKQKLMKGFSKGINMFAEGAKTNIQDEIDQIAHSRSAKYQTTKIQNNPQKMETQESNTDNFGGIIEDFTEGILEFFPGLRGLSKIFRVSVKVGESLLNSLTKSFPEYLNSQDSYVEIEQTKIADPYKIRVKSKKDAETIKLTINQFCAPHIQNLWLETQDRLVRDGTRFREELVQIIKNDIQSISNELSDYLGQTLEVEFNINKIQFPKFKFKGIDAVIQRQQDVIIGNKSQKISGTCCQPDYYVDIPIQGNVYDIDLKETARLIQQKIDEQVSRNQRLLERVIDKQVSKDFRDAEQQINDYMNKFQEQFDSVLRERKTREAEKEQILATVETQKVKLNEYLSELAPIQASLNNWKPV
ncbi:dynamin family protein [Nostoc sp.]|uniref:dynamin family protein n=1 Tax=Nostoc sp. TaxID=1180 RepID=UPI002FF608B3